MKIPKGIYGRIAPCLSLALKHQMSVGGGFIDLDLVGEVKMILFDHSSKPYEVHFCDRIAQIIFEKIEFFEVVQVDELPRTERGWKGFGSTGK